MKLTDEIKKCFEENPSLIGKTIQNLAEWFYLQGLNRHSAINRALQEKVEHYRGYLSYEEKLKADKMWRESTGDAP